MHGITVRTCQGERISPVNPLRPHADDCMTTEKPKSERRQRNRTQAIRMTESEHALAHSLAAESGLSVAAYFRLKALGEIGERAQKRPRPNRQLLAGITAELQRLSAEHNKLGSNLNQIARVANMKGFEAVGDERLKLALEAYEEAVAELGAMRASILTKMGYHDH